MTPAFAAVLRHASRRSLRCGRQIWIEYRAGRIAEHLVHRRGWTLIARVIGTEVV